MFATMTIAMSFSTWLAAALLCGIITLVLAIVAIRQRNMRPFWFSLVFLAITAGCGLMAVYRVATGTYSRITEALKPRTGSEIYEALFGEPISDCLHVTHQQDQIIPKLDMGVSLRVKTCPAEMARILGQLTYTMERSATPGLERLSPTAQDEFSPEVLGDTVITFYHEMEPGRNWRWIYCNRDSSEAIVVDVLD